MQKGEAMTTIFLSYESSDRACAEQVRQGLEQAGYTVWCEPDYPTLGDASYPYVVENGILFQYPQTDQ